MSSRPNKIQDSPSALGLETRRFWLLVDRWVNHHFDQHFDLTRDAGRRRRVLVLLFVLIILLGSLFVHWLLLQQSGIRGESEIQFPKLPTLMILASLRILLIVGIGSSIAFKMASEFLGDVFEVRDPKIARRFIGNLAFGVGSEVLHLREGRIIESDRNSPVVLIGGPGQVQTEFDTAALFERPDGTAHVVGSTNQMRYQTSHEKSDIWLSGFERLREPIISLRDQYIGSLAGEPLTVVGRSLDGMPVSVVDVRGVFSVRRDTRASASRPSIEHPYPVRDKDIEELIYRQPVPVLTVGEHASGQPGAWTDIMRELIRDSLREFVSQNRLSEFLAGIGAQELELSEFREDTILSKTLQISSELPGTGTSTSLPKPKFHSRTELSEKFKKYSSEFSLATQIHGLELHWIGVGTWKMPDANSGAAVNEKHLEAWRMNRENAQRSAPHALEHITQEATLDAKLHLIQETPISSHQKNQARYSDKDTLLECLLQDFWEQLGEALDILYMNGTHTPEIDNLENAVRELEDLLRFSSVGHILGGGSLSRVRVRPASAMNQNGPPAPSSRSEAAKYQALLSKLDGNYKVAEAMIANEARRKASLTREELIERIVHRFERHGR